MQKHNSFIVNYSQDAIDLLEQNGYNEQPAVITTNSEDSPLKIIAIPSLKTWFALCSYQEQTTLKIATAILGVIPYKCNLEWLRKEVENG